MSEWKSLHVFYHDITHKELLLCQVVGPYLNELREEGRMSKWFFINYWEGGPHLRIRVKDISEEDWRTLKDKIKKYMEINKSRFIVSREIYYEKNKMDGQEVDKKTLPWYEDRTIVEIDYEPEYERYGGEKVMNLAEDMFCKSSDLSAVIINNTIEKFNTRFSIAIDLFIKVLFDIGCLNEVFLGMYSNWWGQYLGEDRPVIKDLVYSVISKKVDTIVEDNYKNDFIINYSREMIKYFENLKVSGLKVNEACSIIASHMHMTDNRLSITPEYEYIIAESILRKIKGN